MYVSHKLLMRPLLGVWQYASLARRQPRTSMFFGLCAHVCSCSLPFRPQFFGSAVVGGHRKDIMGANKVATISAAGVPHVHPWDIGPWINLPRCKSPRRPKWRPPWLVVSPARRSGPRARPGCFVSWNFSLKTCCNFDTRRNLMECDGISSAFSWN